MAALPGVDRADGSITDQGTLVIGKNGKAVSSGGAGGGAPGIGGNYTDGPAADGSPIGTITSGVAPTGPGQLVLDDKTAATAGYALGDAVPLITSGAQPSVTGTLVGTVRFGPTGNLVGATLVMMDTPTAQQLYLGGADAFQQIAVTGDGTLSNQELRDAITTALPAGFEAVDDEQIAAENQTQLEQSLSIFTTLLLVFAAVSLFVGSFLILNTFSIVVAQRTRELALFRALGASRPQVTRSVLVEALVIGLIGSTIGLLLGFGLAQGLKSLFSAIGIDLSAAGLVFQWRTAAAAYAVGVLVTIVAAYLPARKASRVPPIAAMRDDVTVPESSLRRRILGGAALTAAGAALMLWALAFDGGLALLGGGVLAVFIGVALLSPVIGRPIVAAIAGPFPRLFGTVGVLARENSRRNPRRTAATASALMIGLALISTMAVLGQSLKSSDGRDSQHRPDSRLRSVRSNVGAVLPGNRTPDRSRAGSGARGPAPGHRRYGERAARRGGRGRRRGLQSGRRDRPWNRAASTPARTVCWSPAPGPPPRGGRSATRSPSGFPPGPPPSRSPESSPPTGFSPRT